MKECITFCTEKQRRDGKNSRQDGERHFSDGATWIPGLRTCIPRVVCPCRFPYAGRRGLLLESVVGRAWGEDSRTRPVTGAPPRMKRFFQHGDCWWRLLLAAVPVFMLLPVQGLCAEVPGRSRTSLWTWFRLNSLKKQRVNCYKCKLHLKTRKRPKRKAGM